MTNPVPFARVTSALRKKPLKSTRRSRKRAVTVIPAGRKNRAPRRRRNDDATIVFAARRRNLARPCRRDRVQCLWLDRHSAGRLARVEVRSRGLVASVARRFIGCRRASGLVGPSVFPHGMAKLFPAASGGNGIERTTHPTMGEQRHFLAVAAMVLHRSLCLDLDLRCRSMVARSTDIAHAVITLEDRVARNFSPIARSEAALFWGSDRI